VKRGEAGANWLIVDTGPWIFGKRGHAARRSGRPDNSEDEVVHVNRTKEEIKNAPELIEDHHHEETYRDKLGVYYGRGVAATGSKSPL
jgi:hypothetical protein